jgi:hypothetical protein
MSPSTAAHRGVADAIVFAWSLLQIMKYLQPGDWQIIGASIAPNITGW